MASVESFISELYRTGSRLGAQHFRSWALEQLRELVPFDAALWGTGSVDTMNFHTVTVLDLPDHYAQTLERTRHLNPIVPHLLQSPGMPIDMSTIISDEAFYRSEIYEQCFSKYGIERVMSTSNIDQRSGLYSLLTLYRFDRVHTFSEGDKEVHRRCQFHLGEAASNAFFLHVMEMDQARPDCHAALCDTKGNFYEVQPAFLDLIERKFPDWQGNTLPFECSVQRGDFVVAGLHVHCEPLDDMMTVQIWEQGPLDLLTQREVEIVTAVCQGLSFKEAARKLDLAPSTISNHLYRVYRKLNVSSRTELAKLVQPLVRQQLVEGGLQE